MNWNPLLLCSQNLAGDSKSKPLSSLLPFKCSVCDKAFLKLSYLEVRAEGEALKETWEEPTTPQTNL